MKKTFSLLLALLLSVSLLAMPAMAAGNDLLIMSAPNIPFDMTQQHTAEALKSLNLFRGSDKGFELDRAPTRMEAIIMLVRLLGKESAIYGDEMGNPYEHPFTDAPVWQDANEYLGYAYATGLTNGKTATTFDPNSPASLREVMTMTLRALNHVDTDTVKIWDIWAEKAAEIGLNTDTTGEFTRGDAVMLYWNALYCKLNGAEQMLHEKLAEEWVFAPEAMALAEKLQAGSIDLEKDDLSTIMTALYAKMPVTYFSIAHMPLDKNDPDGVKYYIGSSDIDFKEGLAAEPMMMAQAHSVVLLRLNKGVDAEQAMETMKSTVDLRKWVCVGVEPENVRAVAHGDLVLLVLDNNNSDAFVNTFLSLAK